MRIRRGDIIWVEFRSGNGHVQRGRRPCLVVSTNAANGHAKIFNVIPGTTKTNRKDNPVHILIKAEEVSGFMGKDTLFLAEQITTIDKEQIICKTGAVCGEAEMNLNSVISRQLGLINQIGVGREKGGKLINE